MKKFNNRPNKYISGENGSGWVCRATVTVTMIIFEDYVLCLNRGKDVTETGFWCMPCGYLDYNETIKEGAYREVYEETGIDFRELYTIVETERVDEPGTGIKQSIFYHHLLNTSKKHEHNILIVDPGEVTDIKWIHKDDIKDYEFTFGHELRIGDYFQLN